MPPAETSVGRWEGDFWISASGYRVARKWVEKYPHLFGPLAADPDHGQGDAELDDALAKALRKIDGYGGMGSTSSERHCFGTAAMIAWNDIESSEDIPPVPEFWVSEGHYWLSGITVGRVLKKKKNTEDSCADQILEAAAAIPWNKVIPIVVAALAAGGVVLPDVIKAVLQAAGMT